MGLSFLKKGKEAHKALQEAEKQAEARAAARGAYRFWVKEGEERMVTFLDGDVEDGILVTKASFNQHNVKINGKFRNYFVCVGENEPCPLCQMDNYATLVCCFTVLDHARYTDRNGKVHQHERKLFVAKRDTMKRLQKLALKRGGLRGWTVSIGRIGDKSPEVGTDFDFLERQDLDELPEILGIKAEGVQPLDYDHEIKYLSADELRELGFGGAAIGQSDTSTVLGKKAKKSPFKGDDDDADANAWMKSKKAKKSKVEDEDDEADEDAEADEDEEEEKPKKKSSLFSGKKADAPAGKKTKLFSKASKAKAEDDDSDDDDADEDDDAAEM